MRFYKLAVRTATPFSRLLAGKTGLDAQTSVYNNPATGSP